MGTFGEPSRRPGTHFQCLVEACLNGAVDERFDLLDPVDVGQDDFFACDLSGWSSKQVDT
jgi:hypothetical protein